MSNGHHSAPHSKLEAELSSTVGMAAAQAQQLEQQLRNNNYTEQEKTIIEYDLKLERGKKGLSALHQRALDFIRKTRLRLYQTSTTPQAVLTFKGRQLYQPDPSKPKDSTKCSIRLEDDFPLPPENTGQFVHSLVNTKKGNSNIAGISQRVRFYCKRALDEILQEELGIAAHPDYNLHIDLFKPLINQQQDWLVKVDIEVPDQTVLATIEKSRGKILTAIKDKLGLEVELYQADKPRLSKEDFAAQQYQELEALPTKHTYSNPAQLFSDFSSKKTAAQKRPVAA